MKNKMAKVLNYVFIVLLICIYTMQENKCSLCKIEVNGYGNADPYGLEVYFKLNNEPVYLRSEELGFTGNGLRGFHLGFVNIRNCSLIVEPIVCDTFVEADDSQCVIDFIGQYSDTIDDVFLLLTTGDAYDWSLQENAKSVLRPLGIPDYHLNGFRHSISLVAIPGCHNVAAVFSTMGNGPSNLHLDIQATAMSKIECGQTCMQSTCTSLTHKNGECIRYLMENYNGIVNASDKYREAMFDQSCSDIFYKN